MRLLRTARQLSIITLLLTASCSDKEPAALLPKGIEISEDKLVFPAGGSIELSITLTPADAAVAAEDFALIHIESGTPSSNVTIVSGKTGTGGGFILTLRDSGISKKYNEQLKITCAKAGISSNPLTVLSAPYMPVVRVSSTSPVTSKDIWVAGTITIDGGNGYPDIEPLPIEIKGRGNTTWGWEKKPYALKIGAKQEVLGMPKHKRWCLIANYMDRTHLRNRTAYYIGQHSNLAWTVRNEYVEVYYNNDYLGLYLLTEQIKEDTKRVNITEMTPSDNSGEAVTGGYLLEMDTNYDEAKKFRSAYTNIPVNIKYPDPEELTDPQLNYIRDYVNKVDGIISGKVAGDPFDYIDRKSLIDFWIIFEITANHEVLHPKSIYFHKDRGGKLIAGPIWDFDYETLVTHTQTTWINYNLSYRPNEFPWYANNWWNQLLKSNTSFRTDVKKRWQEWYPFLKTVPDFITQEQQAIAAAEARNLVRWPRINNTGNPNRDEHLSFPEAVTRLKTVYTTRLEWMNGEIAKW